MSSDPFQMSMIHRTFRNELSNLPGLITAVAPDDTKRAAIVGDYLGNMITVLQHHHTAEDELLWPKLRARTSGGAIEVDRGEDEHTHIAELIDKVRTIQAAWTRSADPRLAEQLSAAVSDLSANANEHFDHEEQNTVPLIGQYITPKEWKDFIDRGAAYVNPRNLWFALAYAGCLLHDATPGEQKRFIASLPRALRMVLKLLGERAYVTYRTRLYGVAG
jgi:iron-sulfur cluster repair protein YtfE (RIC family)